MLTLASVFWVFIYLGVIHLLCVIFSRFSRSTETASNSQVHGPLSHLTSFEILDDDDQFHFNHKTIPDDDQFSNFNPKIIQDDDQFGNFNPKFLPEDDQFDDFNRKTLQDDDHHQFDDDDFNHQPPRKSLLTAPVANVAAAATSKYQFVAGRSFSGYIEQPQSASVKVQELIFSDSDFGHENTVSRDISPPQVYQKYEEVQAEPDEHIALSDDSSQEDEEEDVVDDDEFQDFSDQVESKNEEGIAAGDPYASFTNRDFSKSQEKLFSSAEKSVSDQIKENEISSAEKEAAVAAVQELDEEKKNISSTTDHKHVREEEKESETSSPSEKPATIREVEENEKQPIQEVEEKISFIDARDVKESENSVSKKEEEVREAKEELMKEISSSEKVTEEPEISSSESRTVREIEKPEISSPTEKESCKEDIKGKMTSSESSTFCYGQSSSTGPVEANAEPSQLSDNPAAEEEERHSEKNTEEDLVIDHDFSVSSESDHEEEDLQLQQLMDELIIFSPDGISPRKLSFNDFLGDSDVFYSIREQDHDQPLSPDADEEEEEEKLNDRYFSFNERDEIGSDLEDHDGNGDGEVYSPSALSEKNISRRLGFSDSDEDDELERSFVKGSATISARKEEEWLGRAYEEEEGDRERGLEEDDDDGLEEQDYDVLLEHLATVEKMKKEIKSSRRSSGLGLPTILEESESMRVEEEDLVQPGMVDEKLEYKDRVDEIQRYYRRYWEKMRRLDMLCHQNMNAIGFMQNRTENNQQPSTSKNPWSNLLTPNFCPPNLTRRKTSDPVLKLYRNLHQDFELVYVGQLCLSWEILKWQHYKSEELQLYDTSLARRYNLIAEEFQKFQVHLQRFTEDETYQGPRIQNYVKNRCANRTILQVPLLKADDAAAASAQRMEEGQQVISIAKLTEIIELSTRTFCEFLRADKKDEWILRLTTCQGLSRTQLEDPADAELLMNLRSDLMKKERKMRAIVKSGNCIVQKFQKQREEERRRRLRHELVLAQVELRLVGRVLDMSRLTTDQLLWCHKKLNKVKFAGRIVNVESSSFLLFPF